MNLQRLNQTSKVRPPVIDCTERSGELPPVLWLGAGAAGVGWEFTIRLVFAAGRKAKRPIVVCCGGKDQARAEQALAERFAGGGYITAIEIYEVWHVETVGASIGRIGRI